MRHLLLLLGAGLFLASAPTHAVAQQQAKLEGRALGEAYLSAVNGQYVSEVAAVEFVPFNWYLVVDIDFTAIAMDDTMNASNGLKAVFHP